MARRVRRSPLVLTLCVGLAAAAFVGAPAGAKDSTASGLGPEVRWAERHDVSRPLRTVPAVRATGGAEKEEREAHELIEGRNDGAPDGARDTAVAAGPAPGPSRNFEGIDNIDQVLPPDTNGDVGPNHYVQMVNSNFAIWDKNEKLLYGPAANNTLWRGLGGPCEQLNAGDPIVLYDNLADRWMLSQFAPADTDDDAAGPYYECIAISTTPDPTGSYYRYAFHFSDEVFNDYPHLGVWPDAYYASINQFGDTAEDSSGAGAVAYEREKMLQGLPARQVIFDLYPVNPRFRGQLAADLDGPPPPPGTPGFFAEIDDSTRVGPVDALRIWEFHVDWSNPSASTFGLKDPNGRYGLPNQVIPTAPFNMMLCDQAPVRTRLCITNPGPPLDSLGERLMFRLAYRNFGDHEVLMANHTVDATGLQKAGIRWYELRRTTGPWSIHQQSTFAPEGNENRWMGALAMNNDHGVAVGYSVAGPVTFPGIRYAGRLGTDPLNSLPQSEASVIEGSGTQLHPVPQQTRWGDYSSMSVDPADDCTFWYTQEYYAAFGQAPWQTRVGAFKFPSCTPPVTGMLTGAVTDASTRLGVPGAFVKAGEYSTTADREGKYRLPPLPPGAYSMTASAPGYAPQTSSVTVPAGGVVSRAFKLTPISISTVTGRVIDGGGQGWPLYARIDVGGWAGSPVFTDPVTGRFSIPLATGTYPVTVSGVGEGYDARTFDLPVPQNAPFDVPLSPSGTTCPEGYTRTGAGFVQRFDAGKLPDGWEVTDNVGLGETWSFDNPGGRANQTGGEDGFAIVDSDNYGPAGLQDTELISPVVDFSKVTSEVRLEFDTDFRYYGGTTSEIADVDVSNDGGETWTNVWRKTEEYRGPKHESLDVTDLAAGKPDVQVRFHYYLANWAYWWEVDNVSFGNLACAPRAGGLVVGAVLDGTGRSGIVDATVTSTKTPADTTKTFATPEDLATPDGLFVLFSSVTGRVPFTATAAGYARNTRTAQVVAKAVTSLRFSLRRA
ncbi:MAG: carboxypeptidase-like regulatory domain-containing protein [Actinobacteria bacterium]|nr:carboxypeptidase-like regulatory domain-containing protein [Actinomycetota bacterium]